MAVGAVILARDDVSEDAIYALTADIFDNAADLVSSHAKSVSYTHLQPEPNITTGWLSRYARMVTSADEGAVLR